MTDVKVSVCNSLGKEVGENLFVVTGKLSHNTQPAHVSGVVAGNQAVCQSCQRSVSGKRLELTVWLFITTPPYFESG